MIVDQQNYTANMGYKHLVSGMCCGFSGLVSSRLIDYNLINIFVTFYVTPILIKQVYNKLKWLI